MGFMAGFGPAFADAFNAGLERAETRRRDKMKMQFEGFMERKKAETERDETNSKNLRKAKALAESYGLPSEAVSTVYGWVSNDLSDSQIKDNIENGEFVNNSGTPSMDTQMQDSGLTDLPAPSAPEGAPQVDETSDPTGTLDVPAPVDSQNAPGLQVASTEPVAMPEMGQPNQPYIAGKPAPDANEGSGIVYRRKPQIESMDLKGITEPKARYMVTQAKRAYERDPSAVNEVRLQTSMDLVQAFEDTEVTKQQRETSKLAMQGKGTPTLTFRKINPDGSYGGKELVEIDPENPGGYRVYATKEPVNPDQAVPFRENEQEDLNKVNTASKDVSEKHVQKAVDVGTLLKQAKSMVDFGRKYPGVYAEKTNSWARLAEDWVNELENLGNLIGQDENVAAFEEQAQEIERGINASLGRGVQDAATVSALREAQVQLFTYRLAASMGQSGRGLAENERMIFETLARAGNDPAAQKAALATIVMGQVKELDESANVINKFNNSLREFETNYGYIPNKGGLVPNLNEILSASPDIQAAYEEFRGFENELPQNAVKRNEDGSMEVDGYKIRRKGQ